VRTTLSVDDDVLAAARDRAAREGRSVGSVISELARAALTGRVGAPPEVSESFHGFEPFPPRGTAVTNAVIDRLREDDAE
jgi:plasmid stability protein